jgi:hypothetical protein
MSGSDWPSLELLLGARTDSGGSLVSQQCGCPGAPVPQGRTVAEDEKSRSWWLTMPGILTGIAAIVTAVGGLVGILYQNGAFGGKSASGASRTETQIVGVPSASKDASQPARTETSSGSGAGSNTTTANSNTPPADHLRTWADSEAIVTAKDGATTTVRAETLSSCISVQHSLTLSSGQEIPFEKMRSIEFLHVDPQFTPNARAMTLITLLDRKTIKDNMPAGCGDITGYNDLGRFSIIFQNLKRVDFRR